MGICSTHRLTNCYGPENLHIALDVSANGRLNLPPYSPESPTQIHNVSIFLYSYTTGRNFTITNVTTSNGGAVGDIMSQEPGSTVKHINWRWPDCLVGDGQPRTLDDVRGAYNVRTTNFPAHLSLTD